MDPRNASASRKTDPTLHLPRILCLHGGGVTGEIFSLQSRALIAQLSPYFRLVFPDGPFFCEPGPGMMPVYAEFGPYRRWLRWLDNHQKMDADSTIDEINFSLDTAIMDDKGDGEWVGLMGFSQGAKLSASLLLEQQKRRDRTANGTGTDAVDGFWAQNWKFGIIMAGRAPLASLSESKSSALVSAADISEGFSFGNVPYEDTLRTPTLHVHGLKDPGIHLHQRLMNDYCNPNSVKLVEWEGDHRVPLKNTDVKNVVEATLQVATKSGVII